MVVLSTHRTPHNRSWCLLAEANLGDQDSGLFVCDIQAGA